MANIVIKPASGTLEFNTGVAAGSAVDTTLSGASRLTFDNGELNLASYATGNLNRFTIDGSSSRLFSAYDQMSGSLMSINTIAGFPVFEVFSDNTVVLGKYGSKDFVSTGNKIGIGTAAPANKLEVFGTGDVSVRITTTGSAAATDFAALRFFQGGSQKGSVIANSGVLRIGAGDGIGASSGVYVTSVGNVGIGTGSPTAKLHIVESGTATALYVESSVGGLNPVMIMRRAGALGGTAIGADNVMAGSSADALIFPYNDASRVGGVAMYSTIGSTKTFAMGINSLGNVGIGTTTPTGKLEVFGTGDVGMRITTSGNDATTDFAALRFFQGGSQKGSVIANSGVLRIGAGDGIGATSGVYVTSVGSVGIGIASPSQFLDIAGAFSSSGGWVLGGNPGGPIGLNAGSSAATRYIGAGGSTTNFYHNVPAGGTFRFNIAESEKVRIDSVGNVGIGTTTPTGKLEVFGTGDVGMRITTSGNDATTDFAALRFFQGGAQKGLIVSNNSVLRLSAGTNLSGIFISDSGNVGINSIPTGTSGVRFQVNGGVGSNIAALRFENCGLVSSANIGSKTFSEWLPIQINSTTVRYIPLYT